MGYEIRYSGTVKMETHKKHRTKLLVTITAILFLSAVTAFVYYNRNLVLSLLIPGDNEITTAALSDFVEDIRSGGSVQDAFADFCVEIIENGDV